MPREQEPPIASATMAAARCAGGRTTAYTKAVAVDAEVVALSGAHAPAMTLDLGSGSQTGPEPHGRPGQSPALHHMPPV